MMLSSWRSRVKCELSSPGIEVAGLRTFTCFVLFWLVRVCLLLFVFVFKLFRLKSFSFFLWLKGSVHDRIVSSCVGMSSIDQSIDVVARRMHEAQFPSASHSYLANELEIMALWGFITPVAMQRLAHAYVRDHSANGWPVNPKLQRLSTLGASGLYVQNTRRDFFSVIDSNLGSLGKTFEPLSIEIPFVKKRGFDGDVVTTQTLPIVMPNELFEHIW